MNGNLCVLAEIRSNGGSKDRGPRLQELELEIDGIKILLAFRPRKG